MSMGSRDSGIMTVSELIDNTFGNAEVNIVHHKLLQSILYLLARQLRVLERRVVVKLGQIHPDQSASVISVTELKIQAMTPKTKPETKASKTKQALGKKKMGETSVSSEEPTTSSSAFKTDLSIQYVSTTSDYTQVETTTSSSAAKNKTETKSPGKKLLEKMTGHEISDSTEDPTTFSSAFKSDESKKFVSTTSDDTKETTTSKSSSSAKKLFDRKTDTETSVSTTDPTTSSSAKSKKFVSTTSDDTKTETTTSKSSSSAKKLSDRKTDTETSVSTSDPTTSSSKKLVSTTSDDTKTETTTSKSSSTAKKTDNETSVSTSDPTTSSSAKSKKLVSTTSDDTKTETTTSKSSSSAKKTDNETSVSTSDPTTSSSAYKSGESKKFVSTTSDDTKTETTTSQSSSAAKNKFPGKNLPTRKTGNESSASTEGPTTSTSAFKTDLSIQFVSTTSDYTKETTTTSQSSPAAKDVNKTGGKKMPGRKTSISTEDPTSSVFKYKKPISVTSQIMKTEATVLQTSVAVKKGTNKSSGKKMPAKRRGSSVSSEDPTTSSEKTKLQEHQDILDAVELIRERELRVIGQRHDSRDANEKSPSPMASLESVEATFEKLLVVERVPVEEAKARAAREKTNGRRGIPNLTQISIVTKDQFEELSTKVQDLMEKFGPIAPAENVQLMQDLHKEASLTEAMAAMQLSARLETVEKSIQQMLSVINDLAIKAGIDVAAFHAAMDAGDDIEVIFGAKKEEKEKEPAFELLVDPTETQTSDLELPQDTITHEELEEALQEVNDHIMKQVKFLLTRNSEEVEAAVDLAERLDTKIKSALNLGNKMEDLETLVANFSDQINLLDTGLTTQMTNYQEELTQMQHELETSLENMTAMLVNTSSDAIAIAELNAHFNNLQDDIENTYTKQLDLRESQTNLSRDLQKLREQVELLREIKSDREEVADALRDKAGIAELNGLTTCEQFDAVRGDFETRISMAYDKFNNQEIVWQKALDELQKELNEKADAVHVEDLWKEINRHLVIMLAKQDMIADIVGEPSAAAMSKRLSRTGPCLSCTTPTHMDGNKPIAVQKLPPFRTPKTGGAAPKTIGDGDHGVCAPGYPIPHSRDPRSCTRWCGGSHTLVSNSKSRVQLPGMIVTSMNDVTMERGTDGKMYAVDASEPIKPCSECMIPSTEKLPTSPLVTDVEPYHMCPYFDPVSEVDSFATTPPTFEN